MCSPAKRVKRYAVRVTKPDYPLGHAKVQGAAVSTYDMIADLPLEIEGYELSPLERDVSSDFHRLTTIIHLRGAGEEGLGEDVSYEEDDHLAFRRAGPSTT